MAKELKVRELTRQEVKTLLAAGESFTCFEDTETGELYRPAIAATFKVPPGVLENELVIIIPLAEPEEITIDTGRRLRA